MGTEPGHASKRARKETPVRGPPGAEIGCGWRAVGSAVSKSTWKFYYNPLPEDELVHCLASVTIFV